MNENAKLFVFSTKEVSLIILFNIVVAVTFFILGVKMGKEHSFKASGYTIQDRKTLDVLSGQEESVNQIPERVEAQDLKINKISVDQQLKQHIENELNRPEASMEEMTEETIKKVSMKADVDNTLSPEKDLIPQEQTEILKKSDFKGKYTIQLGSFRTMSEANRFAGGFIKRGFEPIISEAHPKNKGTWFRVSIGIFDSIANLKDFVNQEQNFFRSHNYIIKKIGD